jgi:DNA damage-binding protein 1
VYEWTSDDNTDVANARLSELCTHQSNVMAYQIAVRNDTVLVGDLMKSVSLLKFDATLGKLNEVGRDFNTNWTTAVAFLDDHTFLAAEDCGNLFLLSSDADNTVQSERKRLPVDGYFFSGAMVNRFHHGTHSSSIGVDNRRINGGVVE